MNLCQHTVIFKASLGPWRTAWNASRKKEEFILFLFACDLLGHAGCCSWDPHTTIVAEAGKGTTVFCLYAMDGYGTSYYSYYSVFF